MRTALLKVKNSSSLLRDGRGRMRLVHDDDDDDDDDDDSNNETLPDNNAASFALACVVLLEMSCFFCGIGEQLAASPLRS